MSAPLPSPVEVSRRALCGRALLRLRSGVSSRIAQHRDVRRGLRAAADRVGDDRIDAAIRRHSSGARATRAFPASASAWKPGSLHLGYDDLEHVLGLSRTLRLEVDPATNIGDLVDDLSCLEAVEQVTPHFLCALPPAQMIPRGMDEDRPAADRGSPDVSADAVVIGLIDTGVDISHPELVGLMVGGFDTVDLPVRPTPGLRLFGDTAQRDDDPRDETGHGTACASILCARGLDMPVGVAAGCRLLPVRALAGAITSDGRLTAVGDAADIDEGIKLAVDHGAVVLNLSFGTPETALRPGEPRPHAEAVAYALSRGVTVVAASGNSGDTTRFYPAALPGVLGVASIDARGRLSAFSCRGPDVRAAAPGESVRTATLGGYAISTGTSFAAPAFAGALAARAQVHPSVLPTPTYRNIAS